MWKVTVKSDRESEMQKFSKPGWFFFFCVVWKGEYWHSSHLLELASWPIKRSTNLALCITVLQIQRWHRCKEFLFIFLQMRVCITSWNYDFLVLTFLFCVLGFTAVLYIIILKLEAYSVLFQEPISEPFLMRLNVHLMASKQNNKQMKGDLVAIIRIGLRELQFSSF